ncbi:MAG: magnesium transporter [Proteobacteria bacterium]|nr:magnesium transporter [Pseudomonadota bacterium]
MADQEKIDIAVTALIERFFTEAPKSAANRLETMSTEQAAEILTEVTLDRIPPVWEAISFHTAAQLLEALPPARAGEILQLIDPGKAASVVALLDNDQKEALLSLLDTALADEIGELIAYPENSAGQLMDTRIVVFNGDMTVADAQNILRRTSKRQPIYELRLVDDDQRLKALVDIKALALADPAQSLDSIAHGVTAIVKPMDSREEIVEKLETFRLEELPVIDDDGRLLGIIRHSALIDALKETATIDIQTMVGVSKDERATSSSWFAVRKRMPWLQINLLTAFMAAAVVGLFEGTIAKFTALAILLPVVAGQSGNTGAQALAVTMRGLALREVRLRDWLKVARKEMNAGFWNGISIAATCGIAVYLWSGQFGLVLVIMSSMIIAMVLAGLAGALVPMGLTRLGQDPAVASSIVLTTVTDIAGLFSFLGIATLLSGMLR